ncbi:MAG: hypothetical protein KDE27_31860 [Planctomycetes bacterium]|nr:hypothetical protein [Planctomycetota bacterium]
MRIDRATWLSAVAAIGAGLVVFPFLPGRWPSPLPEDGELQPADLGELRDAAQRVDRACADGDVAAFELAVTPAHRARLQRQLATVQRRLDAATLRDLGRDRTSSFAALLNREVLAAEVRGERAAIAVDRSTGDGVQLLEFVWNGRRLQLDGSRQVAAVANRASARALVQDAVAPRR